jgi:hypothetical protein
MSMRSGSAILTVMRTPNSPKSNIIITNFEDEIWVLYNTRFTFDNQPSNLANHLLILMSFIN